MATELLALAAGADSAGRILTATDRRGIEFLDVLIENEQKEVIAHTVVQRYLQASCDTLEKYQKYQYFKKRTKRYSFENLQHF